MPYTYLFRIPDGKTGKSNGSRWSIWKNPERYGWNIPQGWLSKLSEREGNAQAAWRTDPKKSGKSGAMGDIGTHAAHLAEYITGLKITKICADLNIMVEGQGTG